MRRWGGVTPRPLPRKRRFGRSELAGAIVGVAGVLGQFTCLAVLLTGEPSGPSFHHADAVTGCGELVVGEVTVALWGVDIDDCDGANAVLQARAPPGRPDRGRGRPHLHDLRGRARAGRGRGVAPLAGRLRVAVARAAPP